MKYNRKTGINFKKNDVYVLNARLFDRPKVLFLYESFKKFLLLLNVSAESIIVHAKSSRAY